MSQKLRLIPAGTQMYSAAEVEALLAAKAPYFAGTRGVVSVEGEVDDRYETDEEVLARIAGDHVQIGSIAVIETPGEEEGSATYIAYRFAAVEGLAPFWKPLDGNYSADQVVFENDLVFTANIGVKKVDASGSGTIAARGKTVKEVFMSILAQEKYPATPVQPTASITLTNAGSHECGTKITPEWKTTFTPGSYEFGPATGVKSVASIVYHDSKDDMDATPVEANDLNGKTGSFNTIDLADNTVFKAKLEWGSEAATGVPVTNMGNDATVDIEGCEGTKVSKIAAKSAQVATSSNSITGFRMGRFYGTTAGLITEETVDSAVIRALQNKSNNNSTTGSFTFTVNSGARCIVIAVAGNRTLSKVLNTTVNADMTESFVKCSELIQVAGADAPVMTHAAGYSVWIYTPAEAYASSASLTVTIA